MEALTCSLAGLRGDAGGSNTLARVSRPASVKSISLQGRRERARGDVGVSVPGRDTQPPKGDGDKVGGPGGCPRSKPTVPRPLTCAVPGRQWRVRC